MSSEGNSSSSSDQGLATVTTTHSLVTHELVETALRADKGPDAQLNSYQVKDFTRAGDNYAFVVTSVVIDYTQGDTKFQVTYIAKLNPCRDVWFFDCVENYLFVKEGCFYRDVVPELDRCLQEVGLGTLPVPRFIHAHLERKREVIFLEDLRPKGFKMFDRKKGQDSAHAELILKGLAKLHAASVLLQKQNPDTPLTEKFPFLEDVWYRVAEQGGEMMKGILSNNFAGSKSFAESTPGYEHIANWISDTAPKALDIMVAEGIPTSSSLAVLNHGDCWINNLLFRYNVDGQPVEAILLDFQGIRMSDPGCDLNYYLYSSFNGEDRNAHLEDYLDTYNNFFKQVLDAKKVQVPYTRRELADNYKKHNILGAVVAMSFIPIILMDSEDVADFSNCSEENANQLMEELHQGALKTYKKNPLVKSRMFCLFDDLIRQGKIPSE